MNLDFLTPLAELMRKYPYSYKITGGSNCPHPVISVEIIGKHLFQHKIFYLDEMTWNSITELTDAIDAAVEEAKEFENVGKKVLNELNASLNTEEENAQIDAFVDDYVRMYDDTSAEIVTSTECVMTVPSSPTGPDPDEDTSDIDWCMDTYNYLKYKQDKTDEERVQQFLLKRKIQKYQENHT